MLCFFQIYTTQLIRLLFKHLIKSQIRQNAQELTLGQYLEFEETGELLFEFCVYMAQKNEHNINHVSEYFKYTPK